MTVVDILRLDPLNQDIFKERCPPINVVCVSESALTEAVISRFLNSTLPVGNSVIGLAPVYGPKCALVALALSSSSNVLLIRVIRGGHTHKNRRKRNPYKAARGWKTLERLVLCNDAYTKTAFRMDRLVAALYLDIQVDITSAVDLLSLNRGLRYSFDALLTALGGEDKVRKDRVSAIFLKYEESSKTPVEHTVLQAWAAHHSTRLYHDGGKNARLIDTDAFPDSHLHVIAEAIRHADRCVALKPVRTVNEVDTTFKTKDGKLDLTSNRFKTRIMLTGGRQKIEIQTGPSGPGKGPSSTLSGRATRVDGRGSQIKLNKNLPRGQKIRSVTTVGRKDPTVSESWRTLISLQILQSATTLLSYPFFQTIWLPEEQCDWSNFPRPFARPIQFRLPPSQRSLNLSQENAVKGMLSNKDTDRVMVIQGPPGTGKTTTIATAVTSIMATPANRRSESVYLIAQSNVAVKNIAEKLAKVKFFDFKILVSKDFHFDWHEHLYESIEKNLIRSDDFTDDVVTMSRLLLQSRVILCTLSTLSNPRMSTIARIVPLQVVIVDEASQIEVGDYLPLLFKYQKTLRKMVFIGDDKQLPPHGQGQIPELRSIFEIAHLRREALFLDTQYRMPVPIGNFISRAMYKGELKSVHLIESPANSCQFIDVRSGVEQSKGHSWVNLREVQTIMKLARSFLREGKIYRIITPYDSQRSLLENGLKNEKLPWADKCFNVDSFQGNEEDYIIISLVRTERVGFLQEMRRVNVMLTRCKKGMVICAKRSFVSTTAEDSLVGGLAKQLGDVPWIDERKVLNGDVKLF